MKNLKYNPTQDLMKGLWMALGLFSLITIATYKQEKEDLMKIPEEYRTMAVNNSIEKYQNLNIKDQFLNYGARVAALEIADDLVHNESNLKINKNLEDKIK